MHWLWNTQWRHNLIDICLRFSAICSDCLSEAGQSMRRMVECTIFNTIFSHTCYLSIFLFALLRWTTGWRFYQVYNEQIVAKQKTMESLFTFFISGFSHTCLLLINSDRLLQTCLFIFRLVLCYFLSDARTLTAEWGRWFFPHCLSFSIISWSSMSVHWFKTCCWGTLP